LEALPSVIRVFPKVRLKLAGDGTPAERQVLEKEIEKLAITGNVDFVGWLEGCISVGRLHKESYTQHRWRFEAVETCAEFPFGVKTLYRAYASDRVIEIFKTEKSQCISRIGQLIGLEPVSVHCRYMSRKSK
jgi:glycosyltransferase involved in cell wall biosynthesis